MNTRAKATKVVLHVLAGASLSDALPQTSTSQDARDAAFIQALAYGTCRWYFRLTAILNSLLEKPLKDKDQDIYVLLLIGLYQLTDMRVPAHAAVAETVAATKYFKKPWAKGLVNAVLRNFQRREKSLTLDPYAHPEWMIKKIRTAWPKHWEAILIANNAYPPFSLRVNQQKFSRDAYLEKCTTLDARKISETTSGITLANAINVQELPGFALGEISVQDGAGQLASELLELKPKQHVLDAAAAPGGKATHILEIEPTVSLTAIDKDATRLERVKENFARLHFTATCKAADASTPATWWDNQLFDRILLDAPCSASGVIRRHPDIKLLRRESDLTALAKQQSLLLNALWPLLKPNGLLLYATCSIFPEENTQVLEAFLATHPDAKEAKITSTWGLDCTIGKQILPGMHDMDGFYFARLRKSL